MIDYTHIHLAFFLSRATPLHRWYQMGIFDRETAVYKKLAEHLGSVSIVTSGGEEELQYQSRLEGINILYNRWGLSPNAYSVLAPILHYQTLRRATIYKTNQMDGGWTAILAGKIHRKPVIARAGYLWADLHQRDTGFNLKSKMIQRLERFTFRQATKIFLTTEMMKQSVVEQYRVEEMQVYIVPNYVDTEFFRPLPEVTSESGQICFVGRLYSGKNVDLLIKAVAKLPQVHLIIIGQGEQRPQLEQLAQQIGAKVTFKGLIPHRELPHEINQSQIFILPSQSEGHPKALIEAMACGVAVIGTDVPGINNVIRHNQTGLLCEPSVTGVHSALEYLLSDHALRKRLGVEALAFACQSYSLEQIVQQELQLFSHISV